MRQASTNSKQWGMPLSNQQAAQSSTVVPVRTNLWNHVARIIIAGTISLIMSPACTSLENQEEDFCLHQSLAGSYARMEYPPAEVNSAAQLARPIWRWRHHYSTMLCQRHYYLAGGGAHLHQYLKAACNTIFNM
jgi:hypothetical protein